MADYSVTPANVLMSARGTPVNGKAGEEITRGQPVFKSATDGEWYLLDADDADAIGTQGNMGIALNEAGDGQDITVCIKDPEFTPGITMTVGTPVVGSGTAGGLAPQGDLAASDYHIMLMHPLTTATAYLFPIRSTGVIQA